MPVLSDKQDITSRRRGVIIKQKQKIKLRVASLTKIETFLFLRKCFIFIFPLQLKIKQIIYGRFRHFSVTGKGIHVQILVLK